MKQNGFLFVALSLIIVSFLSQSLIKKLYIDQFYNILILIYFTKKIPENKNNIIPCLIFGYTVRMHKMHISRFIYLGTLVSEYAAYYQNLIILFIFQMFSHLFTTHQWLNFFKNDWICLLSIMGNGIGNANMQNFLWQNHVLAKSDQSDFFFFQRYCIEYILICFLFGIMTPTINLIDHIFRKGWEGTKSHQQSMDKSGCIWLYGAIIKIAIHFVYNYVNIYYPQLQVLPKYSAIQKYDDFLNWVMTSYWIYISAMESYKQIAEARIKDSQIKQISNAVKQKKIKNQEQIQQEQYQQATIIIRIGVFFKKILSSFGLIKRNLNTLQNISQTYNNFSSQQFQEQDYQQQQSKNQQNSKTNGMKKKKQ